jgi:hypothetical protein
MGRWFRLRRDSNSPHQLLLDGLVDLDDLVVALRQGVALESLLLPNSGPQSGSRAARWVDGFVSGETATAHTSLYLTVLFVMTPHVLVTPSLLS